MSTTMNIAKGGYKPNNDKSNKRQRSDEDESAASAKLAHRARREKEDIDAVKDSPFYPKSSKLKKYDETTHTTAIKNTKAQHRVSGGSRNRDKKLMAKVNLAEQKRLQSAKFAMDSVILNTESEGFIEAENILEKTYKVSQAQIKNSLDEQTKMQIYDLQLADFSPYEVAYERSGRHMILSGTSGGHVAIMDALTLKLQTEFHLREPIHQSTFLHNSTLLATAQKEHAYIYDNQGVEIHRMSEHINPLQVQFLPHHWLLCSIGRAGWLKYSDTSTGSLVSQHRTKLGPCAVMRQNVYNSVIHCGHGNGTVTLWSPASSESLVKMLCHRGPITALANDPTGNYMATGGSDGQVKVWDLRTFKLLHSYFSKKPVQSLDISQTGVLGWGAGSTALFWKDALRMKAKDPYLKHSLNGKQAESVRFRPYEDVCGIGHSGGFSSIVVPGVGEANFDSMRDNMFQDKKQRQESEVRSLLDKLSPNMIALDPDIIGSVERDRAGIIQEQRETAANADVKKKGKEKKKARGRNKIGKKLARKHKNIVDQRSERLKELKELDRKEKALAKSGAGGNEDKDGSSQDGVSGTGRVLEKEKEKSTATGALARFF